MLQPTRIRLANELVRLSGHAAVRRLSKFLMAPREPQAAVLARILRANAASRYGRAHRFERLRTVADYQQAVPIVDYDALAPWIEAIRRGEEGVLTSEPVLMLEKSGGSTAASKYIPYTASLRWEFQQATSAWLYDLLTHRPRLRELAAYWSVSPVARQREVTPGGLRVGFEDDSEYFGPLDRWVLQQLMLVPAEVKQLERMDSNRYVTLRHLLESDRLGLISVWNPTFLSLLFKEFTLQADRLLRDLAQGTLSPPGTLPAELHAKLQRGLRPHPARAAALEARLASGVPLVGRDLWPRLQLISCWTSAVASRFVPELRSLFPDVEVQGKGLLATEGVVTFPLLGHPGAVPALDSHFLEFVPPGSERAYCVDELEPGGEYAVLLTTGGGLYRYALHDAVKVVGRVGETPLLDFMGKTAKVSDVVGEKLNERRVGEILEALLAQLGLGCPFAMLAPEWGDPPHYVLFLEGSDLTDEALTHVAAHLEVRLRESHHYAYARDLGQLGAVRCVRVQGAERAYLAGCEALGQRTGDVKPCYLHASFGWQERFERGAVARERA